MKKTRQIKNIFHRFRETVTDSMTKLAAAYVAPDAIEYRLAAVAHPSSRVLQRDANSASVLALTSSSVTLSASSISIMPPLPCLSMVNTARSVTTISTTLSPVSGSVHRLQQLRAVLGGMLHHDDDALDAGDEIHRAAHALDHLAGDHPVGEIAVLRHLHRAEDREVDMAAAHHAERIRAEEK